MKKYNASLLICLFLVSGMIRGAIAQVDEKDLRSYFAPVTQPSPTVASLGKYGNLPIDLSSGAASASISLYEL